MKFFILLLLVVKTSFAQTTPLAVKTPDPVEDKIEQITSQIKSSRENRAQDVNTLLVGYQLVTSWLPSKIALSYAYTFNENWSLEGAYSFSSVNDPFFWIDLGQIQEKRFNLHALRFVGNSFHFSFGLVFSQFSARLGNQFLDQLGQRLTSSFDAQNIGVSGGIGNRWQWSNGITLGIDWIRLNVPVFETYVRDDVLDAISNQSEQEEVKDVIRTFNRIPTFVLFGLSLGHSF